MGLFAKAAAAKKVDAPKSKKETTWLVGSPHLSIDSYDPDKVAKSVHELVELAKQAKSIEAKMGVHKNILKDFAERNYIQDYVRRGVPPDSPLTVVNGEGDKVTFVVQDRSGQYQVKDDQRDALAALLGEDAAASLLYEETTFGFNRDVLAMPGVQAEIEAALEQAIQKLTDDSAGKPVLTAEQAELLLDVKTKTSFKPGTLDRLCLVCGRDTARVSQFLDIAGSSVTRYIKT